MADKERPEDKGIIDDRAEIPPYDDDGRLVKPWPPPRQPAEKVDGGD